MPNTQEDIHNALQTLVNNAAGLKGFPRDFQQERFGEVLNSTLAEFNDPVDKVIITEELLDKKNAKYFKPYHDQISELHKQHQEMNQAKGAPIIESVNNEIKAQEAAEREVEAKKRKNEQLKLKSGEFVDRISELPLSKKINKSNLYKKTIHYTDKRDPKMDTVLKVKDKLRDVVNKGQAIKEDKEFLKDSISTLIKGEKGMDKETEQLIKKHMGSIIRKEMKAQGINVEVGWKQRLSDLFRSENKQNKAKAVLAEKGIDVKAMVEKMKEKSSQSKAGAVHSASSIGKGKATGQSSTR